MTTIVAGIYQVNCLNECLRMLGSSVRWRTVYTLLDSRQQ